MQEHVLPHIKLNMKFPSTLVLKQETSSFHTQTAISLCFLMPHSNRAKGLPLTSYTSRHCLPTQDRRTAPCDTHSGTMRSLSPEQKSIMPRMTSLPSSLIENCDHLPEYLRIHTSVTPMYSVLKHEMSQDYVKTEKDSFMDPTQARHLFLPLLYSLPQNSKVQGDKKASLSSLCNLLQKQKEQCPFEKQSPKINPFYHSLINSTGNFSGKMIMAPPSILVQKQSPSGPQTSSSQLSQVEGLLTLNVSVIYIVYNSTRLCLPYTTSNSLD